MTGMLGNTLSLRRAEGVAQNCILL
jgi:hypothetical protein